MKELIAFKTKCSCDIQPAEKSSVRRLTKQKVTVYNCSMIAKQTDKWESLHTYTRQTGT